MAELPGRLGTLTARDVMSDHLVTLADDDTIEDAVRVLQARHISGAPVVNEQGAFVGILSIADLLPRSAESETSTPEKPVALAHGQDTTTWDLFERAQPLDSATSQERVADRMSRSVTSVTEDAPLVEVARVMCDGHWHRVPVVDRSGALVGIITSMDILAALVNAADEAQPAA